ncbi:MAG TPA: DUF6094 domain-containing protein [Myxococcota bacterium]|nr:DUF6094 domain-containing protein [Myxococcota bacterium]HRV17887.1 DUF6094 domain-containing protein [Myxococcota bacterium]
MRLAGIEKAGFYPTWNHSLELICNSVRAQRFALLLDPCAGEGVALAALAGALKQRGAKAKTYSVEISEERAVACNKVIDVSLHGAWEHMRFTRNAFGCLFLNPPYDTELAEYSYNCRQRWEVSFLEKTVDALCENGLLIYIIPVKILPLAAPLLCEWFTGVEVYRLPDEDYEHFNQVVVFGYKKGAKRANMELGNWLRSFSEYHLPPETLDQMKKTWLIPEQRPSANIKLYQYMLSDESLVSAVKTHGVHTTKNWKAIQRYSDEAVRFRPVLPMRDGHRSSLLASGQMGVIDLGAILAKGRAEIRHVGYNSEGEIVPTSDKKCVAIVDKIEPHIYTVDKATGALNDIQDPKSLGEFMVAHASEIGKCMERMYLPIYERPSAEEWAVTGRIGKGKTLPGRAETGMLDAQRHVAIGLHRAIKAGEKAVYLVGAMSTGKTIMTTAICELGNRYPVAVLAPGHLVEKWAREVSLYLPGAYGKVIESVADMDDFVRNYKPGDKAFAVFGKEDAKLGAGYEHINYRRTRFISERVALTDENGAYIRDAEEKIQYKTAWGRTRKVLVCPRCGTEVHFKDSKDLSRCKGDVKRWDEGEGKWIYIRCNEILFQHGRHHNNHAPRNGWEALGKATDLAKADRAELCDDIRPAQTGRMYRWPVADYVRKKYNGFFKAFIADECHKYKGKGTDQGRAFHHLYSASGCTINATGTLFGGKASDIFFMLYRTSKGVRDDFDYNGETEWSGMYGKTKRILRKGEDDDVGTMSGRVRAKELVRELPGVSPALFSRILSTTAFIKLSDLGFAMPAYSEQIVRLDMDDDQAAQYEEMDTALLERIREYRKKRDSTYSKMALSLCSVWQQVALGRPNCGHREEKVTWSFNGVREDFCKDDGQPLVLEPLYDDNRLTPKEQWLVDYCKHQARRGRKSIVYVRQTGERDIQPRLVAIMQNAGVRAVTLPNIESKKREAWIDKNIKDYDVMFTNPQRVETGLDLIQFSEAIFYEIEYSLLILWQAMCRVWRLGQTQPVKVTFCVYKNTMEERALAYMGEKMKAAMTLYGDDATSVMTEDTDDGEDMLAKLTAAALRKEKVTTDGLAGLMQGFVGSAYREDNDNMEENNAPLNADEILDEAEAILDKAFTGTEDEQKGAPIPVHQAGASEGVAVDATKLTAEEPAQQVTPVEDPLEEFVVLTVTEKDLLEGQQALRAAEAYLRLITTMP